MSQVPNVIMAALSSVFSANGIWPGRAKDKCPTPYGVFTYFGNPTRYYSNAKAGDQNARLQIDIYDATLAGAEALADLAEVAMEGHSLNSSPSMFTATHIGRRMAPPDPDVRLQRVVLEYSVWYRI